MSQNIGQLIQMLSVLGEMQDRKKQLALDERKMNQQAEQFAVTAGINKEDQRFSKVQSLMKSVAEGGVKAHVAVQDLAPLLGFTPEEAQRFAQLAPNASASLQQIQSEQLAQQARQQAEQFAQQQGGYASMGNPNATPQQQAGQAAWLAQNAGGPGAMGQKATGDLIGQMAGNTQRQMGSNPDLANRYGQAYGAQIAARQTPDQFSQGQAFNDLGMAPAAAKVAAGLTPSAGQMLGFRGQQMDYYGRLAGQQNTAGNISDTVGGLNALHQIAKDLAESKYANKDMRDTQIKQYNAMARLLRTQGVTIPDLLNEHDAPSALGRLELWIRKPFGINAPVSGAIQGGQGGGKGGGGNPGAPFGGMRY